MNRHQLREKLMISIYQSQLLKKSLYETVEDNFETAADIEDYGKNLIKSVANEKERFIEYINAVLEDWTFDRLGYLEQSILLLACAEFDCKEISAQVIMDEAINLTKSYCDDNTYKLINGVLDRL
ncbi:MAG: transcription antitermination factor NusB [Erysipelotrichaceae bacterium]|jgi:N utilization substance protein B|nr:transcription antitermination factor NusB [Erysipelotrichaceae bacterium]